MNRTEIIKEIFTSIGGILAKYQVGQKYPEQTKQMIKCLVKLSALLRNKKEKDLFRHEWRLIKDHLKVFAMDGDFKTARNCVCSLGEHCKSKDALFIFFEEEFYQIITRVRINLLEFKIAERKINNALFFYHPRKLIQMF